jgi:hypothetical protein
MAVRSVAWMVELTAYLSAEQRAAMLAEMKAAMKVVE